MPVSPAPHEGPARDVDPHVDSDAKGRFQDLAQRLFGIDRVEFERELERDKAERAAARAAKKNARP